MTDFTQPHIQMVDGRAVPTVPHFLEQQTMTPEQICEAFRPLVQDDRFNHARAGYRIYRGGMMFYYRDKQSPSGVVLVGIANREEDVAPLLNNKPVLGPCVATQPH